MSSTDASRQHTTGWSEAAARDWLAGGSHPNEYALPWRLAVTIAAQSMSPDPVVLDVASGPGGFLATALDELPDASGIWLDAFAAMREEAQANLERFGRRVEYRIGDLLDLDVAAAETTVDLLLTSRTTHHLHSSDLGRFYVQAATRLRPGGWIANLDQTVASDGWRSRWAAARQKLGPGQEDRKPGHPPAHLHTLSEHLQYMEQAGLREGELVWRFCQHALVMARAPT